jgi:hypothetical protein
LGRACGKNARKKNCEESVYLKQGQISVGKPITDVWTMLQTSEENGSCRLEKKNNG